MRIAVGDLKLDSNTGRWPSGIPSVDDLDINIINSLREDPVAPNAHLASSFDVASATIGARLQRLKDEGIARVIGATPLVNAGYDVLAQVWIHLESEALATIDELGQRLAEIDGTIVVGAELGEEQIRVVYASQQPEMVEDYVEKQLGSIRGISRAYYGIVAGVHKERADSGVRSPAGDSAKERYEVLKKTPLVDKVTDVELKLLSELQVDGRLGKRELSRRLDISESMVRSRLNTIVEKGLLKYILVLHPRALGIRRYAAVQVKVDHRQISSVIEAISAMENVSNVMSVFSSDFRLELSVYAPTTEALSDFLNSSLSMLEGVEGYRVTLNARGYKHDPCWRLGPN